MRLWGHDHPSPVQVLKQPPLGIDFRLDSYQLFVQALRQITVCAATMIQVLADLVDFSGQGKYFGNSLEALPVMRPSITASAP